MGVGIAGWIGAAAITYLVVVVSLYVGSRFAQADGLRLGVLLRPALLISLALAVYLSIVLLWVRWGWIVGYLAVDAAMGIGIFRWYYATTTGLPAGIYDGLAAQAVAVGVWGRAALLVALFWVFLHERSTVPDADDGAGRPRAPGAVGTGAGADADAVPVPVTRRPAPA